MATKKIPTKQFSDWYPEEIEATFGITNVDSLDLLDKLMEIKGSKNHELHRFIDEYRNDAKQLIEGWNEDEYKFFFISPFLKLLKFYTPYYNAFTQRPMSMLYDNDTKMTEGRVEWMLAKGRQIPVKPYFFIHEYKPEKRRDNDPLGQVLITMVCAQRLNKDEKPIYGMYINGRNWFFVLLQNNEYSVSNPFVITTDDIFDLFAALEFLRKEMIDLYK